MEETYAPETRSFSGQFATTRWSVILASRDTESNRAQNGLAELCRIYWRPVLFFISRKGFKPEDAEDLAQEFFLKILDSDFLSRADRDRGKFRGFLLTSLNHFLNDEHSRTNAIKRGKGWIAIAQEKWDETEWAPLMTMAPSEQLFDIGWALTISQRALEELRAECVRKGRERVFLELQPFLVSDIDAWDYGKAERALGLPAATVRVLVSRLRERYRSLLRTAVAETVGEESQVDDELRYLHRLLLAQEDER